MNVNEITSLINSIEKKYPVQSWTVGKIDIWPVFKVVMFFDLLREINKFNFKENPYVLKEHPKELPNISSLLSEKKEIECLFFSDSMYRVDLFDIWYNRLSDPLYEKVKGKGFEVVNLDFSFQNAGKFPTVQDTYSLQNQLLNKKFTKKITNIYLPKLQSVQNEIVKYTKADELLSQERLENIGNEMLYWFDIFKEILLRKKVKFVFIVNYYQTIGQALIFTCRELGIKTVDIQHGVQRDLFYHSWKKIPLNGYNTLPDYFWVWENKDALPIKKWANKTKKHKVVIGGNPWLEIWGNEDNDIVNSYTSLIQNFISKENVNVLITLQPRYALPKWQTNIPKYLIEFIREAPSNYKFFVRYHHQMIHKYKNEIIECEQVLKELICKGKVETQNSTRWPLPALLKEMNLHITPMSACVHEAKEFQVPSIMLYSDAIGYFKNEIRSGWLISVKTKDELIKGAIKQLEFPKNIVQDYFGKKEYLSEKALFEILADNYLPNNNLYQPKKEVLFNIYYMDKEYSRIIEAYKDSDSYLSTMYVSYAYRELEEYENELKYILIYLDKVFESDYIIESIDEIYRLIDHLIKKDRYEKYYRKIISWLDKDISLLGNVLWRLFSNEKYNEIIKICKIIKVQTLDSLYFLGRALIYKNKQINAIEKLEEFIDYYNSANRKNITLTNNYLVSAYFYLAQCYSEINIEITKKYLKQCIVCANGLHNKACEMLARLENNI